MRRNRAYQEIIIPRPCHCEGVALCIRAICEFCRGRRSVVAGSFVGEALVCVIEVKEVK